LRAKLITIQQLCEVALFNDQFQIVKGQYPDLQGRRLIHETIRRMVNRLVVDLVENSQKLLAQAAPASIDAVRKQSGPLIGFSDNVRDESLALKRFLRNNLYRHYRVHRMTVKADNILRDLFDGFMNNIYLLPPEHQRTAQRFAEEAGDAGKARAVADYIAGMTDRFAIMEHKRIFDPSELT
jgi:dGTPase